MIQNLKHSWLISSIMKNKFIWKQKFFTFSLNNFLINKIVLIQVNSWGITSKKNQFEPLALIKKNEYFWFYQKVQF